MPQSRLIYAIFEGGGAKGIAHLGAVEAVEKLDLSFAGVAGASAGAFIAALLAAGYRSRELLDPSSATSNLLATQGLAPLDLLGVDKWRSFHAIIRRAGWLGAGATVAGLPGAFFAGPFSMINLWILRSGLGHFSTDAVRDFVNARIRERLRDLLVDAGKRPDAVPDLVRFADLDYEAFPQLRPLKIIATDVRQMRPILFDRVRTPDVPIGDAVAASIAIPLVFRPVKVRGLPDWVGDALFVDGGLVSNLPFWVFGEEKIAVERANPSDPPVPIVAFTLDDQAPAPPPRGPGAGMRAQLGFYGIAGLKAAPLGLSVAIVGSAAWFFATGKPPPILWIVLALILPALANMSWGRVRSYGKIVLAGGLLGLVIAAAVNLVWFLVAVPDFIREAIWIIVPTIFAGLNLWRTKRAQNGPPPFFSFLAKTVQTGIFGSQVIAQSLLRDVLQVPLVTKLTVLGFDRPWPAIREDYITGRQSAVLKLGVTLRLRPEFLEERLEAAVRIAKAKLTEMLGREVGPLRACVIEPFGGQSLRAIHSYNMDADADDRINLDVRGQGAGRAYRTADSVTITFAPGSAPPYMTKYERALLRPTLRTAVCIPIFNTIDAWEQRPADRPKPLGILAIDSDEDLSAQFDDGVFISAMAKPTVLLSPAFEME